MHPQSPHDPYGRHDPYQSQPYSPPPPPVVVVQQSESKAATLGIWAIVLMIATPVLIVALCCIGCFGFGGLGIINGVVNGVPTTTPSP